MADKTQESSSKRHKKDIEYTFFPTIYVAEGAQSQTANTIANNMPTSASAEVISATKRDLPAHRLYVAKGERSCAAENIINFGNPALHNTTNKNKNKNKTKKNKNKKKNKTTNATPTTNNTTQVPASASSSGTTTAVPVSTLIHPSTAPLVGPTALVFVIDKWGTEGGGIASCNLLLCLWAAKTAPTGTKVYCIVPPTPKEACDKARENGVELVHLTEKYSGAWSHGGGELIDPTFRNHSKIVFVGHGLITGHTAEIMRDKFPGSKSILVIHTIPEDSDLHKPDGTIENTVKKDAELLSIAERADGVLSVGPRIFKHYRARFSPNTEEKHRKFIPPPNPRYTEEGVVEPRLDAELTVLYFGRTEETVITMKGVDIICKAIKSYNEANKKQKLKLLVRGGSNNTKKQLEVHGFNKVAPKPFTNDLSEIILDMKRSLCCLMPSRDEPFGLVAIEALALGMPTLIAEDSGAAEYLRKLNKKSKNLFVDTSSDNAHLEWKAKLEDVMRHHNNYLKWSREIGAEIKDINKIRENMRVLWDLVAQL